MNLMVSNHLCLKTQLRGLSLYFHQTPSSYHAEVNISHKALSSQPGGSEQFCLRGYRIRCFAYLKMEAEPVFETSCFTKKLDAGQNPKENDYVTSHKICENLRTPKPYAVVDNLPL
jgi:hypothetical protein